MRPPATSYLHSCQGALRLLYRRQTRQYATRLRRSSRSQIPKLRQTPSYPAQQAQQERRQPEATEAQAAQAAPSIENVLKNEDISTNLLFAPVHIPEDPNAVLKEHHPAASILANSGLVIQRQIEMMNLFLGFEQANRYIILDAQGNHAGYMAEHDGGIGKSLARQTFRTHRPFTAHIFDRTGKEVLRFNRPFSWINSRIRVYDPVEEAAPSNPSSTTSLTTTQGGTLIPGIDPQSTSISQSSLDQMKLIGESKQVWAPLRRKYDLFLFHDIGSQQQPIARFPVNERDISSSQALQVAQQAGGGQYVQFAAVNEPFLSWDFSLLSAEKKLIGSVNRNFAGFGREILTDTGVYVLRMDSAGLSNEAENRHIVSQTGQQNEVALQAPAMTLDQRAVMLATAVSVDFDYFSRHSGSGGMFPIPLWMGGGEAAGAGAAGAEAAGAAGAAESTGAVIGGGAAAEGAVGTLGRATGGASGAGEGAMAGAGTVAGYEMMQRGANRQPQEPPQQELPPQDLPPSGYSEGEELWGRDMDPWNQQGQGNQGGSDGGGGSGGDGDSFWDFFDDS